LSQFEKFVMRTVLRSSVKGAPYNPRSLTNQARARLKRGIEKHGLVQPIIVNERTGQVVGGHQRLGILDDLEAGGEYELQVAVVNVSESDEKRLNVLLNNDGAQGHWDETKLLAIMAESEDLDMDALGFSSSQSEYYEKLMKASDDQDNEIIRAMVEANELVDDVETIGNENLDERHKVKIDRKTSFEQQVSSLMKPQDESTWKVNSAEEKSAYNRARENFKEESFEVVTLRIAFSSMDSKKHFLTRHGLPFKDTIHESELYASSSDSGSNPRNEPTRNKDDDAGSGEPVDNEWET